MLDCGAMNLFSDDQQPSSNNQPSALDGKEQMHAEVERVTYRNDENAGLF